MLLATAMIAECIKVDSVFVFTFENNLKVPIIVVVFV